MEYRHEISDRLRETFQDTADAYQEHGAAVHQGQQLVSWADACEEEEIELQQREALCSNVQQNKGLACMAVGNTGVLGKHAIPRAPLEAMPRMADNEHLVPALYNPRTKQLFIQTDVPQNIVRQRQEQETHGAQLAQQPSRRKRGGSRSRGGGRKAYGPPPFVTQDATWGNKL